MNIYGKLSLIMYLVAFCFMCYAGKTLVTEPYFTVAQIISLMLILSAACLAAMSGKHYDQISEEELKKLESLIKEKKMELEKKERS